MKAGGLDKKTEVSSINSFTLSVLSVLSVVKFCWMRLHCGRVSAARRRASPAM
jgi:hypothetical protein